MSEQDETLSSPIDENEQPALISDSDHHQHLLGQSHHYNQLQQHEADCADSVILESHSDSIITQSEPCQSINESNADEPQTRTVKLPLLNIYAKGGYCVQMRLGSEARLANLIVDTGSSTLVVKKQVYQPHDDTNLQSGTYAQQVIYGAGGWDGPLVHTRVSVSEGTLKHDALAQDSLDEKTNTHVPHLNLAHQPLALDDCPVAIVPSLKQQQTFADADGILGLAYYGLNKSYNLKTYIDKHEIDPASTFPWPFSEPQSVYPVNSDDDYHDTQGDTQGGSEAVSHCEGSDSCNDGHEKGNNKDNIKHNNKDSNFSGEDLKRFRKFLKKHPQETVVPYFTRLKNKGLTDNRFAFHSKRSSIHIASETATTEELANDPLNRGWLILGGGKEHTELYQGKFKTIDVIHNRYYNVKLYSMSVGDQEPVAAPALQEKYIASHKSNAIIDTGVSGILLTNLLYEAMLKGFNNVSEEFVELVTPFKDIRLQEEGIDMAELFKGRDMTGHHPDDLSHWPTLHFTFDGEITHECPDKQNEVIDKAITISCKPEHYWQLNSPKPGKACFKIVSQLPRWPNQCLLGLPLLNDYYVIFDRSAHETGVIRFAEQS